MVEGSRGHWGGARGEGPDCSSLSGQASGITVRPWPPLGRTPGLCKKTWFFWSEMHQAVGWYCQICPNCQVEAKRGPPIVPLPPLPIIKVPLEWVAMDFMGPLPRSTRGFRFLRVTMDYASQYLEAILLQMMQTIAVAQALIRYFGQVGLPKQVLMDRGTSFTSALMKQLCRNNIWPKPDGLLLFYLLIQFLPHSETRHTIKNNININ